MTEELGPMGCILDEAATQATVIAMTAAGQSPIFGDARPALKGHWQRLKQRGVRAVLLPQLATKMFPDRGADFQRRGTCVGRGTYRACWLSYLHAIDSRQLPGRPAVIAYEPIYAGARVEIGGNRISGDGAVGAYAARWVSQYGVCERATFGPYDLSGDSPEGREDLAVKWGTRGVPDEIEAACSAHRFDAHLAEHVDDQMDAISAGYAGAFCRSRLNGPRDKFGMSRPAGQGAHCEAVVGVFVGHNGEDAVLMWQSWGNQPSGPSTLKLQGGEEYQLPQGCYGIFADDQRAVWGRFAESWHFQPREGSQW